jgi:hypothetical protein
MLKTNKIYPLTSDDKEGRARRALAFPLYLLAFFFELLGAGLTAIAAGIAGDPR